MLSSPWGVFTFLQGASLKPTEQGWPGSVQSARGTGVGPGGSRAKDVHPALVVLSLQSEPIQQGPPELLASHCQIVHVWSLQHWSWHAVSELP